MYGTLTQSIHECLQIPSSHTIEQHQRQHHVGNEWRCCATEFNVHVPVVGVRCRLLLRHLEKTMTFGLCVFVCLWHTRFVPFVVCVAQRCVRLRAMDLEWLLLEFGYALPFGFSVCACACIYAVHRSVILSKVEHCCRQYTQTHTHTQIRVIWRKNARSTRCASHEFEMGRYNYAR